MAGNESGTGPRFVGPDGKVVDPAVVETDLRNRLAQCEGELEEAVWQLVRFFSAVRRTGEARACVDRLLTWTKDPHKVAAGYLGLGQLLEQEDRYAEAEVVYANGAEIMPPTGDTGYFLHNNRGYCLNLLGRHAEAEEQCRTALALNVRRHNAHKNLGLALAGQGQFKEAAHALLEANRRCPADGRSRRHLFELVTQHPDILENPDLATECEALDLKGGSKPAGKA